LESLLSELMYFVTLATLESARAHISDPKFHSGWTTDEDANPPAGKRIKSFPSRLRDLPEAGNVRNRKTQQIPPPPKPATNFQVIIK